MAVTLHFVTSNKSKVDLLRMNRLFACIDLIHLPLPLVEPQADSIEAVALSKAQQAFQQIAEPLIVEDSGFFIKDLSGFPGPYTRYVLETIGVAGVLKIAELSPSRRCAFISVLVYMDRDGRPRTFIDTTGQGRLATEIDTTASADVYSEMWRIFIPEGRDKPISALREDERATLWSEWEKASVYNQLGEFLAAHSQI
jgi:non-canonical purine NTP pyrophosphatase (RdgB/HAM1 family)